MKSKADILLHPVRMRIVKALLEEKMTVYQLINKLGDVPQATMYRQLNTLADADLVKVIEERLVKGKTEKVYSVVKVDLQTSKEVFTHYSQDEHLRFFMTYHAHLLREMQQYLLNRDVETYNDDGLNYEITPLHLSDEEKNDFFRRYHDLMKEFASKKPSTNRQSITLATMFIPSAE